MRIDTESTDPTWILTKAELTALLTFASKDETRVHLNAVCFAPGMGHAAATDGHRLALAECKPVPSDKQSLLSVADLERAKKAVSKRGEVRITPNCTRATVAIHEPFSKNVDAVSPVPSSTSDVALVNATFPPYAQIITPDPETSANHVGVNTRYLADLDAIVQACGDGRNGGRLMIGPGELDPIKFRCEAPALATTWTAMVMPMRI